MTTSSDTRRTGPYVGPVAFGHEDRLYGRDREVRKLLNLLIAERIVLLYSPSGAGKTSLIRAQDGLIRRLEDKGFVVLGPVRVGLPPGETRAIDPANDCYVRSVIHCLDDVLPPERRQRTDEVGSLDLATYLSRRRQADGGSGSPLLIFDQFEEILTLNPVDHPAKEEFFRQLGAVLRDRSRWALFAMREDYVAGLDPYLHLVPTQFSTTFRLDLLEREAAHEAIQLPARDASVDFSAAAAEKLIRDLSRVRMQAADGTIAEQAGRYVEPVQLQVVCLRLWARQRADPGRIVEADVENVGDVDAALAGYYAERVEAISCDTGVRERKIREWFDHELITKQRIRGQVLKEFGRSGGLENGAVQSLVDAHLVREENSRGVTWYELAHDRLIHPILNDNAAWFQVNLSTLQLQAQLWHEQGRPDGLLLSGQALLEAEEWADAHRDELIDTEKAFLEKCQEAQRDRERTRARHRLAMAAMACIMVLSVAVAFVSYQALTAQKAASDAQKAAADAKVLQAAEPLAAFYQDDQPDLALLMGLEATRIENTPETRSGLLSTLERAPQLTMFLRDHTDTVNDVAYSLDGKTLASASADRTIILWDPVSGRPVTRPLRGHEQPIWAVAFSPDGKLLASGDEDGQIILWDAESGIRVDRPLTGNEGTVRTLAFSPDGQTLASGGSEKTIRLWTVATGQPVGQLRGHTDEVRGVAFSPDGSKLASGSADQSVRLWDVRGHQQLGDPLGGHSGAVWSVAFSPDGKTLASGSSDMSVMLWNVADRRPFGRSLMGHTNTVTKVAFRPDGRVLASAGGDKTIMLWDMATGQPLSQRSLSGHAAPIMSLAFSPDGRSLASGGLDKSVIVWDLGAHLRLGQVLAGHLAPVRCVALSPDGRLLASAGEDNRIILWSTASRQPAVQPISGHTSTVTRVVFSPDGTRLASASQDNTIALWNAATGQRVSESLGGQDTSVLSLAYSPDGKTLASGGSDKTVRLWDVASGESKRTLSGHADSVWSLAFSSDGKLLASGGEDGTIFVWDADTGQPISQARSGHQGRVSGLAFVPKTGTLVSASLDQTIMLWDVGAPELSGRALARDIGKLYSVDLSSDGRTLAVGKDNGSITLWDVETGRTIGKPLETKTPGTVWSVAFSSDGKELASGSRDGTVRLWNVPSRQPVGELLMGHGNAVESVAFSPDGKTLASGSWDQTIGLWGVSGGSLIDWLVGHKHWISSVAFSPDGKTLASGSCATVTNARCNQGEIRLWDVANHQASGEPLKAHSDMVRNIAFSPDGKTLASAGTDGTIVLWDTAAASAIGKPLKGHAGGVVRVAFSPDGRILASGGEDTKVRLWDVAADNPGPIGLPLAAHEDQLRSLAFSPDGRTLASGDRKGVIYLWDIPNAGEAPRRLDVQAGAVLSLAFSPDGTMLASASFDRTVRLWDAATGRPMRQPLVGHAGPVRSVAFSPDGKLLASGGDDGKIVLWDIDFESWRAAACRVARRSLTPDEWQRHLPGLEQQPTCAYSLFAEADLLALEEGPQRAEEAFVRAVELAAQRDDFEVNNAVCWYGSIDGLPRIVMPSCERALVSAPQAYAGQLYDSRGLAHALMGDTDGAIADFKVFLDWVQEYPEFADQKAKREAWVHELEQGRNPFDETTVKALRRE